jgi:hypothetical protein
MSSEVVRELRLKVTYEDAASGPSKQFHDGEKARIRQTAAAEKELERERIRGIKEAAAAARREEQEYLKAVKLKLRAEADFAKEIERRIRDREKEEARAAKDAAAEVAKAAKAAAKAQADAHKEAETLRKQLAKEERQREQESIRGVRATAKAQADAHKEGNALLLQLAREEAKAAAAAEKQKLAAAKETAKQRVDMERVQHAWRMREWSEEQAAVKSQDKEVAGLLKTYMGFQAVQGLAAGIATEWKRVADEIGESSREWQKFRQSLQGVASLSDKMNTNAFAKGEIDRAERARVTPEEAKEFREGFLARASLYVGDGKEAKLSEKDADELQTKLMEYAKDKGVSQREMSEFAGGLLAQQKGPTNAKDMLARAGRVFGVLEASSAPVAHLLPMTTRAMAQGFTPEQAGQTLAQMPEIAPEEEGTYLLRAVSALRETVQHGKGEKLGLNKAIAADPYKLLTTAVKNIRARAARGEDMNDLIAEATHGEEVSGRALRGLVNQGPEGFDRWRGVVERIPEDQVERIIKRERTTEPGLQRAVDSRKAVERARMGLRGDTIERRRAIAETELMAGGELERIQYGQVPAQALVPFGADDMRTRMINMQAIRRARAELHESPGLGDAAASLSSASTNALLAQLLKRLELQHEEQRKQTALMQAQQQRNQPPPMANAVPPMAGGNGARMGR